MHEENKQGYFISVTLGQGGKIKMRENIIVMVGGRSGVGKTSIIDFLVKNQGERYARPLSYTSRLKRNGEGCEEYNFISEEKMILMRDEGRFLNFDCVYGNYYAIAKKSIDVINTEGKVPIKEIHPSNQAKIKLCYPNAVSVLIKEIGVNGEEKRIGREKADTEYYENLNEDKFATVYKGNIIKNLIMDCQSYTKYRPNETTGGIFVSWRRKEELPTGA